MHANCLQGSKAVGHQGLAVYLPAFSVLCLFATVQCFEFIMASKEKEKCVNLSVAEKL